MAKTEWVAQRHMAVNLSSMVVLAGAVGHAIVPNPMVDLVAGRRRHLLVAAAATLAVVPQGIGRAIHKTAAAADRTTSGQTVD